MFYCDLRIELSAVYLYRLYWELDTLLLYYLLYTLVYTWIVTYWATIQICATNQVNMVLPFYWRLMATATILSTVFNLVTHGDHTYKAIWTLDIGETVS